MTLIHGGDGTAGLVDDDGCRVVVVDGDGCRRRGAHRIGEVVVHGHRHAAVGLVYRVIDRGDGVGLRCLPSGDGDCLGAQVAVRDKGAALGHRHGHIQGQDRCRICVHREARLRAFRHRRAAGDRDDGRNVPRIIYPDGEMIVGVVGVGATTHVGGDEVGVKTMHLPSIRTQGDAHNFGELYGTMVRCCRQFQRCSLAACAGEDKFRGGRRRPGQGHTHIERGATFPGKAPITCGDIRAADGKRHFDNLACHQHTAQRHRELHLAPLVDGGGGPHLREAHNGGVVVADGDCCGVGGGGDRDPGRQQVVRVFRDRRRHHFVWLVEPVDMSVDMKTSLICMITLWDVACACMASLVVKVNFFKNPLFLPVLF